MTNKSFKNNIYIGIFFNEKLTFVFIFLLFLTFICIYARLLPVIFFIQ
ncbi:hypothetical protein MCEGE10_02898 [Flavobacteriaceae bacterium]